MNPEVNEQVCTACGHTHEHMASVYYKGKTDWYCHEDDHSCYEGLDMLPGSGLGFGLDAPTGIKR